MNSMLHIRTKCGQGGEGSKNPKILRSLFKYGPLGLGCCCTLDGTAGCTTSVVADAVAMEAGDGGEAHVAFLLDHVRRK